MLIGITGTELTTMTTADLGDYETLNWRLEREYATQYVTWKQEVLRLMCAYLGCVDTLADKGAVISLGTTSYYHAWELACKAAFGDLLDAKLRDLPIPLQDCWREQGDKTLLEIIPRPIWQLMGNSSYESDGLIPDAVTFSCQNDGSRVFHILDAKYYAPQISKDGTSITKQPGLESVAKQFLYQSAYRDFIRQNNFTSVENAFLVPSEDDVPEEVARVSYPGVMSATTGEIPQFSDYISMRMLPAYEIFECYLERRRYV